MVEREVDPSRVGVALASAAPAGPRSGSPYDDESFVQDLVRQALNEGGLGIADADAPLADVIRPDSTVLLKPNWVLHENLGGEGMDCMVTHPVFLRAALREVLRACPKRVIIGDAPVQGCRWEELVTPASRDVLRGLAQDAGAALRFQDFRRTVVDEGFDSAASVREDQRDESRYVLFDLGADSALEPISDPPGRFRVTQYDPRRLHERHQPGRHQYLLCREAFEVDVVLSLPKLKTHRKAGITGALKNLVGLNGNKDYLPHHRRGGTANGGDCYPGRSLRNWIAEACLDQANRRIGTPAHRRWTRRAYRRWPLLGKIRKPGIEGSWHGNDTVWRMVHDLNRILRYGRADGTMADEPQRVLRSLTDAIVTGQGDGPLAPSPLQVGAVTYAEEPAAAEVVHAALLRLDPDRIALVREVFAPMRWPLGSARDEVHASVQGSQVSPAELAAQAGRSATPPSGWAGHVEWEAVR